MTIISRLTVFLPAESYIDQLGFLYLKTSALFWRQSSHEALLFSVRLSGYNSALAYFANDIHKLLSCRLNALKRKCQITRVSSDGFSGGSIESIECVFCVCKNLFTP